MNSSPADLLPLLERAGLTSPELFQRELARRDPAYFIDSFVWIDCEPDWKPFKLWQAQRDTLGVFRDARRVVVLKARQLGLSWLSLSFSLWLMLFRPGSTVLIFSKGEREANDLLGRLKGMVERLPGWLRPATAKPTNTEEITLANGSNAKVFPTTGGRSYTGSLVVVDEADWFEGSANLDKLLNAVKPTIDAGGQIVLLSSPDKSRPESLFKSIYRAAREGKNNYTPVFLPWHVRPERTADWYAEEERSCLNTKGTLDDLHQEYPGTEAEALAPRSLDKRIPPAWLQACYAEGTPLTEIPGPYYPKPPAIPGLVLYELPAVNRRYVVGADPAEGNPTSDDSSFAVLDQATGAEVACLSGKVEMTAFGGYVAQVAEFYHRAGVLVERNNHGHAVLKELHERKARVLAGLDGKPGWLTNAKSKTYSYDLAAEAFRDGEARVRTFATLVQLMSVEGNTLRAPEGQHDDRAIAFVLALVAAARAGTGTTTAPTARPLETPRRPGPGGLTGRPPRRYNG